MSHVEQIKAARLTPDEIFEAVFVGAARMNDVIQKGRANQHNEGVEDCWQRHIEGAIAERTVAKTLGLYWPGKGDAGDVDLPPVVEVRSARDKRGKRPSRMIIKTGDTDKAFYFFVTITGVCDVHIHGFMEGGLCKKPEFWESEGVCNPAYFVPREKLHPWAEWPCDG